MDKLLNEGFFMVKLKTSLHIRLTLAIMTCITVTEYLCHRLPWICSISRCQNLVFPFHRIFNMSNTTGVTNR